MSDNFICDGDKFKSIIKKAKYIYIALDMSRYCRAHVRLNRVNATALVSCGDTYDYLFSLDMNYEDTVYIEKISRTLKNPLP